MGDYAGELGRRKGGHRKSQTPIICLLLVAATSQLGLSSANTFLGRRRPRLTPRTLHPGGRSSFTARQRKILGDAAETFIPYEDDDRDTDANNAYHQPNTPPARKNRSGLDEEMKILQRVGIRPFKLNPPPKYGQTSLSMKLIMANVFCYALQMFKPSLTQLGAKRSDLILQGKELHRLITPVFLHGGLVHLMMNCYSLSNIGPQVEQVFGPGRYLATYLASGVAGNLLSAVASPNPAVGASGAIFGLMGAYYVFLDRNERLIGGYGRSGVKAVTGTIATNIAYGFINPMIDNWGHIGGAIGGAAMAYNFGPKLFVMAFPDGRRIVVDKPNIRLPKQIQKIGNSFRRKLNDHGGKSWGQQTHYQSKDPLPSKPWGQSSSSSSRLYRSGTPTRDILKPRARWNVQR